MGALSIILFIPTAKNFQSQRAYKKPMSNRVNKKIDNQNAFTEKSSSESPRNSPEKKIFSLVEDQFAYYLDDSDSSSRSETTDIVAPRTLDPDSEITCFFLHIAKSGGTSLSVQVN